MERHQIVRVIKLVDICAITTLYFVMACAGSIFVDSVVMGPYDTVKETKKSTGRLMLDLLIYAALFSVLMYAVRNITEMIPSPLNGLYGFEHHRLSELKTAGIFSIVFFWMQYNLRYKVDYLYERVTTEFRTFKDNLARRTEFARGFNRGDTE